MGASFDFIMGFRDLDDDLVKPGNLVSGILEHVTSRSIFCLVTNCVVTHLAKHFMVEYQAANSEGDLRNIRLQDRSVVKWLGPPPGRVNINVDVATRVNGATIVVIVAQDHNGYIQMTAGRSYPQSLDPMVGETLAIKAGLKLAKAVGMESMIIESDCQGAVRMLNEGPVDLSDQEQLITDCLHLIRAFQTVQCSWVYQEVYRVTHEM